MHWTHRYDAVAADPAAYDEHAPKKVDEASLAEFGRTHLSHFHIPAIPIPGLSTLEKKLVFFICDHTGAPNPFHALERMTGDCVELERVEKIWQAGYQDLSARIDELRAVAGRLTPEWQGPEADRFEPALSVYLDELDALAGCVRTTWECVRAVRSEAQLAEGTIQMLINILIGSLGGLLVAEFVTAGTVTPVAAAQAQVELAYVAKKIAFLGGKLNMVQSDVTKILDAVRGFKRLEAMRFIFDLAAIE
ncbi:hypothetical protein KDK95_01250 [Actinospica sp. MGRD01-02]|uniref:Uncharacterized protein n=1 Tax=Actinospica acidithermotolerans TaxID=2828514 RepID=A0A941E6X6_9ACTN|nr:hypothetical protein [Actinospica acidithermotolerans]MBR7824917.1 hypothetical protein [Actinospica acidithermotolerans]